MGMRLGFTEKHTERTHVITESQVPLQVVSSTTRPGIVDSESVITAATNAGVDLKALVRVSLDGQVFVAITAYRLNAGGENLARVTRMVLRSLDMPDHPRTSARPVRDYEVTRVYPVGNRAKPDATRSIEVAAARVAPSPIDTLVLAVDVEAPHRSRLLRERVVFPVQVHFDGPVSRRIIALRFENSARPA